MQFGLSENIIAGINKIFEENAKIDKAIIFGSRAKGNYKAGSDIDIALKGQHLNFDDILKLHAKLNDLNLVYEIDLLNYDTIKEPALKEHIDRAGIEFYSRWKKYRFSDFVLINPTVSLKSNEEYSFVEMKDLKDGSKVCSPSTKRKVSSGARFQERDTLFARITPCLENGKICQVRELENGVGFGSTEFLVFRGRENVSDNDFVFYLSRWNEVRDFAENNFEGTSGRQRVPKNCFDNLKLELPPIIEQTAIASILSSLDDKIDLLQRQNKTLEQLAETLFRQWFLEEAEENWEVGTLEDEFGFTMGQSPLGSTLNEDEKGMIFYQGRSDFSFRFPDVRIYTTEPNRIANKFETLVSVRAPVGDMNMAIEECCLGRGVAAFRYNDNKTFYSYTYYKMRSLMRQIKQFEDNGSVFGSIGKDDFKKLENIIPAKELVSKFQNEVKAVDEKIYSNTIQIKILIQTRDTLLPKLMSGEVRVKMIKK